MAQPASSTAFAGAWEADVEPLFERDEAPVRARNVKRTLGPALLFLGCVGSIGVMRRAQLTSQWPWEEMSEVGRVAVSVGAGMDAVPTVLPDGDDGAAPASTTDDDAAACDATAWAGEDYQYMFGAVWDSDDASTTRPMMPPVQSRSARRSRSRDSRDRASSSVWPAWTTSS
jgi:hypothetical protein